MDRSKYEIEIKRYAFIRAMERNIDPDLIENTIMTGKVNYYGKNYVKFISRSVICVGEITGQKIKIFTVEWRN
ncbi:hypothetical protein HYY69_08230 [Candidatus Woesearchaeota archaeon]|nr:hypothetical protein [Candidatus Woesearchaeota archaeon]